MAAKLDSRAVNAALPTARRTWLLTLLGIAWLCLFTAQWLRIDKEVAGARRWVHRGAETAYVAPVPVLRMASLGHQSFLADLLFVRAAHYFVDHLVTDSRLPWLDLYLHAIWGLDAHNRTSYRWGSQVIKFGQRIDEEVSLRASRYARMGLEIFPDDPWLYHEIAYNLRYGVEPKDAADKARLRALALRYLDIAYSFPAFTYDPNYLATQYLRAGQEGDSVRAALSTYAAATEDQRADLRRLLEERNEQGYAAELAWFEVVRARDWPWLPPSLVWQVGPRRKPVPPLQAWDVDAWGQERAADPALLKRLGVKDMRAPMR
jgi:hypothetical protein